ncbi:MAG TPA: hypothetical protein VF559_06490 [Caulobacteraceae bacterium]
MRRHNGEAAGRGLPARRLEGRRVVVVLGASPSGLSLLSRTLHALGVDMLEGDAADMWSGGGVEWRRPWIGEFHDRLLRAIDRAPDHPAHALPFPPGWWRRPVVQAIRREMTKAVEAALEDHAEPWGFADVATARLLPVWSEVFERLGLQPDYIWALTHPSKSEKGVRRLGRNGQAEELNWFAYSSDVYRYAGERIAAVVEENAWRDDPQALMDKLLGRLRLHWRGTRLDLFETLSALLEPEEEDAPVRAQPSLPIALTFYEAAAQVDEDPDARERLDSLVEGAELLRPMISPFLGKLANGASVASPGTGDVIRLEQEVAELRATCGDLRKQLNGGASHAPEKPGDERTPALELELELEARSAEIRWLHDQYRERLAEVEAESAALRTRLAAAEVAPVGGPAASEEELAAAHAEIQRLTAEMRNLNNANERYLARIYELKKALEERGGL